ncbi:hypothetical protein ACFVS2_25060 [Brevibacillus sp. NPDC058079]|uniref:hypothetical protein n=1 Tax=Brevibacillus sp. NPDC058079 TaxID=3346330 RepID=UPI0036E908C3
MLLNGNTIIQGTTEIGFKLLEGIREFDTMLLSSKTLTIDGTRNAKILNKMLTKHGKVAVRMEPSASLLMVSHVLMANEMNLVGKNEDESGQSWAFFERNRKQVGVTDESITVSDYIKSAMSILCIEEQIVKTARTLLTKNYKDNGSRTFVMMYDKEDTRTYEAVKKHSFIYETSLLRVVLEDNDLVAVA